MDKQENKPVTKHLNENDKTMEKHDVEVSDLNSEISETSLIVCLICILSYSVVSFRYLSLPFVSFRHAIFSIF